MIIIIYFYIALSHFILKYRFLIFATKKVRAAFGEERMSDEEWSSPMALKKIRAAIEPVYLACPNWMSYGLIVLIQPPDKHDKKQTKQILQLYINW